MKMMIGTISSWLLLLLARTCAPGSVADPRSAGCDLCVQIVTAIDDFITDASTEQDIIDFVEEVIPVSEKLLTNCVQLCDTLGWPLSDLCENMVESYIPDIIDGLVNNNLEPGSVCQAIGLCEAGETTHPSQHTTTTWWDGGQIANNITKSLYSC